MIGINIIDYTMVLELELKDQIHTEQNQINKQETKLRSVYVRF